MYRDGLTIDQALSQGLAGSVAPLPGVDEWVVPLADTEEVGELSSAEPVEDTMPEPPSEPASEDESEPALEDEIKPVETPETQDIAAMMSLTEPLTEEEEPEQE
jgi:hypothetical protein